MRRGVLVLLLASGPLWAQPPQNGTPAGGTSVTGQPHATPLPGADVPAPLEDGRNRSPAQKKAGELFDNVPPEAGEWPGPSAPSKASKDRPKAPPPDVDDAP